jgi:hypothetical protein
MITDQRRAQRAAGPHPACSMRSGDHVLLNFGGAPLRYLPPGFSGVADSLEWMARIPPHGEATKTEAAADAAELHVLDTAIVALPGQGLRRVTSTTVPMEAMEFLNTYQVQ